jgi:archaellum component FlaG (FlaF/FlaG flagellin family)
MICNLQPVKKKNDDTKTNLYNTHMSVLPIAGQDTGEGQDINESMKKRTSIFSDDVEIPLQTIADCGKHLDYYERNRLRVGIIIKDIETSHHSLAAMHNPASSCKVTALAVLEPPPSFSVNNLEEAETYFLTPGSIMRKWMSDNNLGNHSESVAVLGGEEGAQMIVQREDVDAIFIIVPDE